LSTCRTQYAFAIPLVVQDVDPWITRPRRPVHLMTATVLPRRTEAMVAHTAQVTKADAFGVAARGGNDFGNGCHGIIIDIEM